MEPKSGDVDDILESSVLLEKAQYGEGFRDGYNDGLISGKEEGREVGLKSGFQVGEELGFYQGCVDVWESVIRVDPVAFSSRLQKSIEQLRELVRKYPLLEPENEHVQDMMGGEKSEMLKSATLACCKLYISEGRNALALESIERAARLHPEAAVVNRFRDEAYNRVGYTLVSLLAPLKNAVLGMVDAAFDAIALELHSGTHPRVGVVDHICFHPLAHSSLDQAAGLAKSLAADIGRKLQVPTFLYGAAHEGGRTLDDIRRELGYFKPNSEGNQWAGGFGSGLMLPKPDEGPNRPDRARGVVVVGATGWVDNYNVPVRSTDIEAARRIGRRVSGRGGGLKSVQAMGLAHGPDSTEVACNLLDPSRVGADLVQVEVERLAREEGLTVGGGYFTDFSQEKIIEIYESTLKNRE